MVKIFKTTNRLGLQFPGMNSEAKKYNNKIEIATFCSPQIEPLNQKHYYCDQNKVNLWHQLWIFKGPIDLPSFCSHPQVKRSQFVKHGCFLQP